MGNQLYNPTPMADSARVEGPIRLQHLHVLVELFLKLVLYVTELPNIYIFQAERLFQANYTDRVVLYYYSNDFLYLHNY